MPTYSYRCPECMFVVAIPRPVALRGNPVLCLRCLFNDKEQECERIPDAPNFSVGGYSAKNGYSKSS